MSSQNSPVQIPSFIRVKSSSSKVQAALQRILNYNGELEDKKIANIYYIGKKRRKVYKCSPEYSSLLRDFKYILEQWNLKYHLEHAIKPLVLYYTRTALYGDRPKLLAPSRRLGNLTPSLVPQLLGHLFDHRMVQNGNVRLTSFDPNNIIKFDLSNAFNSTTYRNFVYILVRLTRTSPNQELDQEDTVLNNIILKFKYLFINDRLPQGFCTSNIIFNIVMAYIDLQAVTIANKRYSKKYSKKFSSPCTICNNITSILYIRYIDDYLISIYSDCTSHNYVAQDYYKKLAQLFYRFGYHFNRRKSKIVDKTEKIKFLGYYFNTEHIVSRKIRKRIRAMEYKHEVINKGKSSNEFMGAIKVLKKYYNPRQDPSQFIDLNTIRRILI